MSIRVTDVYTLRSLDTGRIYEGVWLDHTKTLLEIPEATSSHGIPLIFALDDFLLISDSEDPAAK